jgi:ATP-dependent protease ClpP protease subunit
MNNKEKLEIAEKQTETILTDAQKESGNYKKGKVELNGFSIVIENPRGSIRSGIDSDGKPWKNEMFYTYGFLEGTVGSDGDEIDVFIGPLLDDFSNVFLVTQIDPSSGLFDEHKVLLGFESIEEAKQAYLRCYSMNWKGLQNIKGLSLSEFKKWLVNKTINKNFMEVKVPRLKTIKLEGEVLADVTLPDLIKQAGNLDSFDSLDIEIASPGGDVSEGIYIMMWLDALSESGKNVTSIVTANAYSIASLIMLAANKRKISRTAKVMVHNPMKPELTLVNANDLEVFIKELRDLEKTMYTLYKLFTGIEEEKIKSLMDNETYLSADEAIQFGFADEIVDMKQRPDSVAINKPSKINMKSTLNILNSVIAMVRGSEFVNQLYYDNAGGELEIYQNDPASYSVGDKTNVAEGERVLSDGAKITIVDSTITEISREAVAAPVDAVIDPVAPVAPAMIDEPVVDPIAYKPAMVDVPVEAPAMIVEEDKPVMFNEGPAPIDPVAVAMEGDLPVVVSLEHTEEPIVAAEHTMPDGEIMAMIKAFEETVAALKGRVQALEDGGAEVVEKLEAQSKFEALATEAIDTIAKNTVSNFAPTPRTAVNVVPSGGSIFAQMKARTEAAK